AMDICIAYVGKPFPAWPKIRQALTLNMVETEAACAASKAATKGIEFGDGSLNADLCTDFHEFACSTWLAKNPIPVGKPGWRRRVRAHDTNEQWVKTIPAELSAKNEWRPGRVKQLGNDHYVSYVAEADINAASISPLAPMLAEIDGAGIMEGVQQIIRRLHDLGIAAPFSLVSALDYHVPAITLGDIAAGVLGLPDRFPGDRNLGGRFRASQVTQC
ncbi:MAG: M13 family metallopeptidase N-terminal domain-containing protein, partial [Betaproteobacteria bacterium]